MIQNVTRLIAEKLALGDKWTSQIMLKPMGYDLLTNKFTIAITSETGQTKKFIVKVSNGHNLNDLVQTEANNIESLLNLRVEGVPPLIAHGLLEGRYFIAQEFIVGRKPHSSKGTFDAAYELASPWLGSLLSKTQGKTIDAETILKRTEQFCKTTSEFFDVMDSTSLMEKLAPKCEIPTYWAHGDFWHGNMLVDMKGKVWVTDYAFSAPEEPPIDVLDFISDYEPWVFLSKEKLGKYTARFVPREINPLFLVLYLLNRKIALKVREKTRLYDELLSLNLSSELASVGEAGILRDIIGGLQRDVYQN